MDFYISFGEKSCNNPSSRGSAGHESTESDFLVPMPPRGTESIAREVQEQVGGVAKKNGTGEEARTKKKEKVNSFQIGTVKNLEYSFRLYLASYPRLPKQVALALSAGLTFSAPCLVQ